MASGPSDTRHQHGTFAANSSGANPSVADARGAVRATSREGRGPGGLVSIGDVLARLREEFPDVTMSKLRFLEAEGLVEPRRTPAGYRKYSDGDIERLRYVLSAQRDRFLPLRVIRDQLAAIDRGEPDAMLAPDPMASSPATALRASAQSDARARYSRDEVLQRSELTEEMLAELEATGLLGSRSPGWYDGDALIVARVAGALAAFGLAPRHLRAYRAGADREVGMFAQLLAPLQRSGVPAAQTRAAEVLDELATLSQELHGALVRIGLREVLGR